MKVDYRDATKRNMPREWFSARRHTHVALDDAIRAGRALLPHAAGEPGCDASVTVDRRLERTAPLAKREWERRDSAAGTW